ncbi:glutaminyl-peptide cyclotransferase [Corynebacterium lizhenjunii]|uniref:Glutaminyl-peptide cyclotransferase n=2 Tax=Corynebacterium lizhenjunii TaxID=2709394 RepID=A0A7T0PBK9_9CORY|nr:glutaminyl-peptide cyclotransferase [Corynebacterium lizhenjunii]
MLSSFHRPLLPHFLPAVAAAVAPALILAACSADAPDAAQSASPSVERLTVRVHQRLDFDPASFTQGLEATTDGQLWVGTGQRGQSRLYRMDPATGAELASVDLDQRYFGEGITQYEDSIWQLTWQAGTALRYDRDSLELTGQASYPGEGWGLCATDTSLYMSDGTSQLRRLNPDTFAEEQRVSVTLEGREVDQLNELECVDGQVYANVWFSTDILRIDPTTGRVTAVIDASAVPNNAAKDPNNVLNGIAHIPGTDHFYLTGKRWPDLYRVSFEPEAE